MRILSSPWLVTLAALGATGCSSLLGIEDLHLSPGGDPDAPPRDMGQPPGGLTFTGTIVRAANGAAIPGATISFYTDAAILVKNGLSDAQGKYALAISQPTPVDGYFEVTNPGALTTFSHLMFPTTVDPTTTIPLSTRSELDTLSGAAGCPLTTQGGLIVLHVFDASGLPKAGATVSTTHPAGVGYSDPQTSLPKCDANLTTTSADGLAYVFAPSAGDFDIIASENGTKFAEVMFSLLINTVVITPLR